MKFSDNYHKTYQCVVIFKRTKSLVFNNTTPIFNKNIRFDKMYITTTINLLLSLCHRHVSLLLEIDLVASDTQADLVTKHLT